MGLLERIAEARTGGRGEQRSSIDQWLSEYLIPAQSGIVNEFAFGGGVYGFGNLAPNLTYGASKAQEFARDLPGHTAAVKACPPAFGSQLVRAMVLSQARFVFRNVRWSNTPRKTFGSKALSILDEPWPGGTTGMLTGRMEWHAGLAGNAYVTNWQQGNRLRVLRPDFTAIAYGSQKEPDDPAHALDGELLGYIYQNGGIFPGNPAPVYTLPASSVVHWAPLPDPLNAGLGMSWITPAVRDIQGDMLASQHKITYYSNGATPNLVVKGIPAVTKQQFDDIVNMLEGDHAGVANAYRTLYLTAGADATVVGSNMAELDFRNVQAGGETRISVLSRVPASLLGIGEGLAGSSLNAGNFSAARRSFGDTWIYPTLQDLAATLAPLVTVPGDAELWFDTADMPVLREDAKDAADIEQVKSVTIMNYVREGFTPDSVVAAVNAQDITLLKHSGLISVQLWAPGQESARHPEAGADSPTHPTGAGPPAPAKNPAGNAPAPPAPAQGAPPPNGNAPAKGK